VGARARTHRAPRAPLARLSSQAVLSRAFRQSPPVERISLKITTLALAAMMAVGLSAPAFAMTTGVTNTDTHSVVDGTLVTCDNLQTWTNGYLNASAFANKQELNLSLAKQASIDAVLGKGSLNATATKSLSFSGSLENSGSNSFQHTNFATYEALHQYFTGIQSQTQDSHTVSAFTNL
jgi:hypothetical protein